ncbi:putative mitochondrial Complex I, 40kd subunit [Sugiyamaella lignohabitans]|uniref:Putative mitochondrial Complex I, 40kd subunit n=1 Tax=Sugiyamaella lignohabitans TaxID=796027 RepID=A0A167DDP7_9ASCO|nr:putative mitochondrial Complex I, 40kd subunit [Sugiyamaella lignohabitans]ANB12799.1 putative mitochondrial Complex I, 40kd subunit [Sugiyamaella lignohabitans]
MTVSAIGSSIGRRGIQTFENLDSQVNITRTGKTLITQGTGGRSSRTGYTATVFGAPGFLGTVLTAKLARQGTITVAPFREEIHKRHLKVTGDLGVVNFMEWDIRNIKSIEDSVKHSDIVYNLVGRNYTTKNFSYHDVNVEGAKRIAEAVKKFNVPRLVHVSSHSVDPNSASEFYRTKALGEEVVRDIIPDATIVRPGPMYGLGDKFLNKLAQQKYVLLPNEGKETFYPTLVNDVATALEKIGYDDSTAGKTFELNGPKLYTKSELLDAIRDATKNEIKDVNISKGAYQAISKLAQNLFWATTSPDEIERMFIDQVVDKNALGFGDLGITPKSLESRILHLLRFHRSNVYLHETVEAEAARKKDEETYTNIIDRL